jgi:hypothetical protein
MTDAQTELRIIRRLVSSALAAGYTISVNDGEETVLVKSTSQKAIIAAMFSTDEDYLHLYRPGGTYLGWIRLIYGNGSDVISDHTYTPELTTFLEPISIYAESLA